MIRLALFVSFVALAAGLPTYSVEDPRIDLNGDWRVVGGTAAGDGEYPFIVSLRSAVNSHFCGGSILNSQWILTAAHCIIGRAVTNTLIVAGTNTLNAGGVSIFASRLVIHAYYNENFISNDIGVIQLSQVLTFSSTIAQVVLNTGATGVVSAVLLGWGQTNTNSALPNALQHLDTYTITTDECRSFWGTLVSDNQICALIAAGKGVCSGDSGGPLIQANPRAQLGIVSFRNAGGCAVGYPDVYTRVSAYISWIRNAVSSYRAATNTLIVAGTNTLNAGGVSVLANRLVIHADYNENLISNDVGVIQLSQVLTFSSTIAQVGLNTADTGVVSAILLGWGQTYTSSALPNELQHLDTYTITTDECRSFWGTLVTYNQICALIAAGKGACNGDSGGPLIQANPRALLGIVSFGNAGGCAIGYPDVYTRVSAYISWISNAVSS